jgi:hypothetical protein
MAWVLHEWFLRLSYAGVAFRASVGAWAVLNVCEGKLGGLVTHRMCCLSDWVTGRWREGVCFVRSAIHAWICKVSSNQLEVISHHRSWMSCVHSAFAMGLPSVLTSISSVTTSYQEEIFYCRPVSWTTSAGKLRWTVSQNRKQSENSCSSFVAKIAVGLFFLLGAFMYFPSE